MTEDSTKVQEARKITLPELYNRMIGIEQQIQQLLNMTNKILMQDELQIHLDVLRAKTLLDTIRVPTQKERDYQQELTVIKQIIKETEAKNKDNEGIKMIVAKIDELSKSQQEGKPHE